MYKWTLALAFVGWSAALSAQGVLTGQVTDRAGEPLVGANVWVVEAKTGNPTNQNGVYQIDGLPPGAYTVRVSYVGYERVLRKTSIREGTSKTILHIQLEEEIVAFEELVVSATRAGRKTPFTYVDLGREELEENNLGQDVPFQLQWTPSTVVTSDAGTGIGYTGIWIRGTDPSRINVTINGIPLNDAESQQVFWVDLPDFLSSTEDVQIQRGVGTSTNGAGAFGATVNLNTVKFNPEPYAT
ncbi:MAG: TonB-dependent receptor, partial [Saprospiraceae bacterium]|nr:TonB-dependent receptor [Saprospiraceae bacterium]